MRQEQLPFRSFQGLDEAEYVKPISVSALPLGSPTFYPREVEKKIAV